MPRLSSHTRDIFRATDEVEWPGPSSGGLLLLLTAREEVRADGARGTDLVEVADYLKCGGWFLK